MKMDGDKAVYEVGSGSYSFTSLLTIEGSPLSSVSLTSDQTKMIVGDTTQLKVTAKKENGVTVDLAKAQSVFKSSDVNVATVDAAGKVKTVGFGKVKITVEVTYEGVTLASSMSIFVSNGTNLALGKNASSNNTISVAPTWHIANLTDGNFDLRYSSNGFASKDTANNPIWVEIDLGSVQPFNNLVLYPRLDSKTVDGNIASFPIDFDIQVKADNGEYKTVKQVRGESNLDGGAQRYSFETEQARYVKVVVTQFGAMPHDDIYYRFQLAEAEVYNVEEQTVLTGPSSVSSGQAFDIAYRLSGVTESVYAQDLSFTYDPEQMEFLSVDSLLDDLKIVAVSDVAKNPGKVRILSAVVGGDLSANVDLLVLHMRAKSASSVPATLTLSDVIFANGTGVEKEIAGTSYSVQIGAPINKEVLIALIADAQAKHDAAVEGTHAGQYPVGAKATLQAAIDKAQSVVNDDSVTQQQLEQATTELTSALQAFKASVIIATPGDTNGDDRISIGDLAIVASYYGKTSKDPNWNLYEKADINKDGVIDIADLAALARMIIG